MKYLNGVLATAAAIALLAPVGAQAAVNTPAWLGDHGSPGVFTQADGRVLVAGEYDRSGDDRYNDDYKDRGDYRDRGDNNDRGDYRDRGDNNDRGDYRDRGDNNDRGDYRDHDDYKDRGDNKDRDGYKDHDDYKDRGDYKDRDDYKDEDKDHKDDKEHRDNGRGNGVDPAPGNSGNSPGDDADGSNTPETINTSD
jgi:hypothetical protein